MTIVAGFHVNEGILLCSDTQYTGEARHQHPKIAEPIKIGTSRILFALAGSEETARMAIEDCADALQEISPGRRSLKCIKQAIRAKIRDVYRNHVEDVPNLARDRHFDLLVAIWHKDHGINLYSSENGGLSLVRGHRSLGHGDYLFEYLIPESGVKIASL